MVADKRNDSRNLKDVNPSLCQEIHPDKQISAKEWSFHTLLAVAPLSDLRFQWQEAINAERAKHRSGDFFLS